MNFETLKKFPQGFISPIYFHGDLALFVMNVNGISNGNVLPNALKCWPISAVCMVLFSYLHCVRPLYPYIYVQFLSFFLLLWPCELLLLFLPLSLLFCLCFFLYSVLFWCCVVAPTVSSCFFSLSVLAPFYTLACVCLFCFLIVMSMFKDLH